jgi:hypothetical protein
MGRHQTKESAMGKISIALFVLCALYAGGCGSECGDLQDVCDLCTGSDKTECEAVANADDGTACQEALPDFEAVCE